MKITVDNQEIIFTTQSTKSKKMLLDISDQGHISVKVPAKTPKAAIDAFITANAKVIFDFQYRLANRKMISSQKSYAETDTFLYYGKAYTLEELIETLPESKEEIQVLLKNFYTKKTKQIVKKRVAHFEKIIGVKAKSIKIVDSPQSWGTCNNLKELTFNYKLSMAPIPVIDYVVIHELCHILHLNHERSFWRKVGAIDPDFKKHQDYLSHFGGVMTI